ncbi:virulence factor TspB C-terminal domain-related protein [Pseudomonas aeruginosa]|uniref:virulence factor TspB C-terminal domain-related protein n=1 Tax=Pseudomonas aeruginosa TaxID=287 RepID=UPI000AFE0586|nr:virulence factor TspB C-terminal domain-related protein [Pseudomonas aeruginosa]
MRKLIVCLVALFSAHAYSAGTGYSWSVRDYSGSYESPAAACEGARVIADRSTDWSFIEASVASLSGDRGFCYIKYFERSRPDVIKECSNCDTWALIRSGNGCKSDDETYNPSTGVCETSNKCKETYGQELMHEHKVGAVKDGHFTDPVAPPSYLCQNSCRYGSPATTGSGNGYRMGQGFDVFVVYSYLGEGVECEAGSSPDSSPPSDKSPSGSNSSDCTNKVTDAEGRVHYSCTKTDSYQDPGNLNCGTANGQIVCTVSKPSPNKTETTSKTDVTESKNPDGSSDKTSTTETTVTTCKGMNACSSSTTTNVTNGRTNSDGTDGGSSTECKGAGCKPSGEGAGGDSEGEEKEEEKESSVSGDESCDAVIACEGDAIQCAMLKQEKKQTCAWDYEKAKGTIESEIAKPEYRLTETTINTGELFNAGISASRWLPSACPAPKVISLSSGPSQTFSWEPECQMASSLAPIIVGLASLFFAVYVGRSIGG